MELSRTVQTQSWRPSLALLLLLSLLLLWPVNWARAMASASPLEQQVKAAYLYKFAGFVEWPEGSFARSDASMVIAVAGNEALAAQLERTVAGRSVNGHPVQVRRVQTGADLAGTHILFVDAQLAREALDGLLAAARGQAVLTVSDSPPPPYPGVMINFIIDGARLRFDVALREVGPSKLKISARMLAVAHHVGSAS